MKDKNLEDLKEKVIQLEMRIKSYSACVEDLHRRIIMLELNKNCDKKNRKNGKI